MLSFLLTVAMFATLSLTAFAVDTENPSDITSLDATALDSAILLEWSEATDDTGVEGYTIYYGLDSVTAQGQEYDLNKDVGDVLEYTMTELENGTPYYFSVVAYDEAGNESLAWAPEASATPSADAGDDEEEDTEAPQVTDAEALNREEVKVVFSEDIVLPEEDPQDAFQIENDDNFEPLIVIDAKMDEDAEGVKNEDTVILTTDVQEEGVVYKLTVGIDIKDKADNPVISGTSDTAIFTGSGEEKVVPSDLELVDIESVDNTHIMVNFSKKVVLDIDPSENFVISTEGESPVELEVLGVQLGTNDEGVEEASVLITTAPQEEIDYNVSVKNITDEDGNEMADTSDFFTGMAAAEGGDDDEVEDIIAPLDVANLLAEKVLEAEKYLVTLKWDIPEENVEDTVAQTVYESEDGEDYTHEADLEADVTEYEVSELDPGEYWFKVTQSDAAGNESEGTVVNVILSETGPGIVGLIVVSLGLGHLISRRKRN